MRVQSTECIWCAKIIDTDALQIFIIIKLCFNIVVMIVIITIIFRNKTVCTRVQAQERYTLKLSRFITLAILVMSSFEWWFFSFFFFRFSFYHLVFLSCGLCRKLAWLILLNVIKYSANMKSQYRNKYIVECSVTLHACKIN